MILFMKNNSAQEIFDGLRKHPEFRDDPDLRLDDVGFIVERHSYGAVPSFGWRVAENGTVLGNIAGKLPLMG